LAGDADNAHNKPLHTHTTLIKQYFKIGTSEGTKVQTAQITECARDRHRGRQILDARKLAAANAKADADTAASSNAPPSNGN
jgi:hypothetical protein